ncbi:MAG: amidohydrolase, partial [Pseudomonadota bacterium]
IYTANDSQPTAQVVVTQKGKITYVGDLEGAKEFVTARHRAINFKGKALYPGFVDAHAHLAGIGFREMRLNLDSVKSLSHLKEKVAEHVQTLKNNEWIEGRGWIETHWPEKRFPNRGDVDELSSGHPLILARADGHGALVNSKALELAGITSQTPDPKGGKIVKDKKGRPTGILLDKAIELVTKLIPEVSDQDLTQAFIKGAQRSARLGWTGVHDTSGSWKDYEIIDQLMSENRMPIRVYKTITATNKGAERLLREGPQKKWGGRLSMRSLKVFADGALGSRGAALLHPYHDSPQSKGLMIIDKKTFVDLQKQAMQSNIQIRTHAIGDRANRNILDWFEIATKDMSLEERKNLRWRVEHAQVLHKDDLMRFAKLGLIASMQPSHAIGDLHFAPKRLGAKRLKGAYAWKSLLESGVLLAGGSDAPVEQGDPRVEFYAAIERKDLKGYSQKNWHPEEKLNREQALKMFTLWAAYAAFEDEERGSIEVGKYADFTAFSGDIMKVPAKEIPKLDPIFTVVQGNVVHSLL